MLKKTVYILIFSVFFGCTFETPTQFSEASLQEKFRSLYGSSISLQEIINQHKGKKILLVVWGSWCADCVKGFPKIQEIQKKYPEMTTIFISVDKNSDAWKNSIKRYQLIGKHYNLPKGMKNGTFVDFIRLNWIPRYLVLDEFGKIILFKATKATDQRIIRALQTRL